MSRPIAAPATVGAAPATPVDKSLRYFKVRFPDCDAWQISATGTKDFVNPDGIRVAPALTLLRTLP